jgi:D-alanyl-D-alanine dipeptidase
MVLVEIVPPDVDVDIDLIYATDANITGRPIYRQPVCLLHPHAAAALRQAVTLAHAQGCRLRVFDAFRPAEAQWRLWEACPDPEFIADPRSGSSHTRGVAVDLTLADAEGRPFDMGTGFDDMTAIPRSPRSLRPTAAGCSASWPRRGGAITARNGGITSFPTPNAIRC